MYGRTHSKHTCKNSEEKGERRDLSTDSKILFLTRLSIAIHHITIFCTIASS